jgi:hypothetical protein
MSDGGERPAGQQKDLMQVGTSTRSRDTLNEMKAGGHISDALDGYRMAIALAVAMDREPHLDRGTERKTSYAVGGLDPDNSLMKTIAEIYPQVRATPARAAEDLAEQGLEMIRDALEGTELSFTKMLRRVEGVNRGASASGDPA